MNLIQRAETGAHSVAADVQSIDGVPLFPGFLEPTGGCINFVPDLCKAIRDPNGFFPQKHLYASLHGAYLWNKLCDDQKSHIAKVYARFPLGHSDDPLTEEFGIQAAKMMAGHAENRLGVIALGAGTGERETKICKWLADKLNLERLDALVLDVSSELLGISLQEFRRRGGEQIHPHFAVMDFELTSGLDHLKWIRKEWAEHLFHPVHAVLFLLLGNTFGCVDETLYLKSMADVMQGSDLLLCESALVTQDETESFEGKRQPYYDPNYKPLEDNRAHFICDPLRSLGINPQREQLKRAMSSEAGKWLKQQFIYEFSAADEAIGNTLTVTPKPKIAENKTVGLLEVKELTAPHTVEVFGQVFSSVKLVPHDYRVPSPSSQSVRMGYVFASAPKRGSVSGDTATSRGEVKSSIQIEIDAQKLEYSIAGETGKLCATHLALVAVLNQVPPDSTARDAADIRDAVIEWLEQYVSHGSTLRGQQANRLKNLKEDKTGSPQRTISPLKRDTFDGLKDKKSKNCKAAAKLLGIWPKSEAWSFKSESS